ncbi:MAG: hypothetical protein BA866_00745 [Desulfobulbaceae bacterium S5133MH15]|nr:MAG: hypothetical protein BA866_00745 [Desulfobulbaceae bacterium S5133MH15]
MEKERKTKRRQRFGRPCRNPEDVRSKRIATFVTMGELAKLERIVEKEGISLSAVVYRMISNCL